MQLTYRPDIDGLRALAVLAVVGFHAFPTTIRGGFVGVDIFFVISGFLISKLILQDLAAKTFDLREFYYRRIRRIFPALVLVLVVTYVLSMYIAATRPLDPVRLEIFAHIILAAAGFVSNIFFWMQSGYFNDFSTTPLQHLWSLSVEEQFYLIWPGYLLLTWRRRPRLIWLTILISLGSLAYSAVAAIRDPISAFYLPHSRFWELMIGATLAHSEQFSANLLTRYRNAQSIAGGVTVLLSVVLITRNTAFPGIAALGPTIGTFLLISAGPTGFVNRLLQYRVLVWIGLISYPIYLWHPVVAFFLTDLVHGNEHVVTSNEDRSLRLAGILLSIILAWLTYRFVEKPLRRSERLPRIAVRLVGTMAVLSGLALVAMPVATGLRDKIFDEQQLTTIKSLQSMAASYRPAEMYGNRPCFIYDRGSTSDQFLANGCFDLQFPGRPVVFLYGDSHSASLSIGLRETLRQEHINFTQMSSGWCEPTVRNGEEWCERINSLAIKKISELEPDLVIVDMHWIGAAKQPYFSGTEDDFYTRLLDVLAAIHQAHAKRILVVGQVPLWFPSLPVSLFRHFTRKDIDIPPKTSVGLDQQARAVDGRMKKLQYPDYADYISLIDGLCDSGDCMIRVGDDVSKDLLLWDYGHLSVEGSRYVSFTILLPEIYRLLRNVSSRHPDGVSRHKG